MTYALSILKDKPRGLWVLDAANLPLDSSAAAGAATAVGSFPTTRSAALVSHGGTSAYFNDTLAMKFPKRIYKPGYEQTSFSLEAWVFPFYGTTTANIVSHLGTQDGLAIQGSNITFSIRFTGSTAKITYPIDALKAMHVVGTYTPQGMTLYVNGELFKQLNFTEAQRFDDFASSSDPGNFYLGGTGTVGNTAVQGVAIYEYALNLNQIMVHYKNGRDTVNPDHIPTMYGGMGIDLTDSSADIFLHEFIGPTMSWHLGDTGNLTITGDGYLAQQYEDGVLQEGAWTYAFNTEYAGTDIAAVRLGWEGTGTFIVETSVDGTTWVTAQNNQYVSSIVPETQPPFLLIRVTFPENGAGQLHNLDIVGLKSNELDAPGRTITFEGVINIREEMNPMEYRTDTGLGSFIVTNNVYFGPSSAADWAGDHTWEYWFYTPDGAVGVAAPNIVGAYVNGIFGGSATVGGWSVVHITSNGVTPMSYLQLAGNLVIGRVVAYPTALTAAQVANVYNMYTGKLTVPVDNTGTITVSSPSVEAYSSDWSQTSAG